MATAKPLSALQPTKECLERFERIVSKMKDFEDIDTSGLSTLATDSQKELVFACIHEMARVRDSDVKGKSHNVLLEMLDRTTKSSSILEHLLKKSHAFSADEVVFLLDCICKFGHPSSSGLPVNRILGAADKFIKKNGHSKTIDARLDAAVYAIQGYANCSFDSKLLARAKKMTGKTWPETKEDRFTKNDDCIDAM